MVRGFDEQDQAAFAILSGDANPMHMDAEAARRLAFDRPLVHGLHGVLRALDHWLQATPGRHRLRHLAADFRAPVAVGDPVAVRLVPEPAPAGIRIDVTDPAGAVRMTIRLVADAEGAGVGGAAAPWPGDAALPATLAPVPCRERDEAALAEAAGTLPLALDPGGLEALAPHVAAGLPPVQIAFLLATTRLVGMDCPGLHSVFSGLTIDFDAGAGTDPVLRYRVDRYDPRFRFVEMAVEGAGARGTVRALVRARPVAQPTLAALRPLVPAGAFAGRRVLVVGGSRGLGETCAKLLAAGGAEVAITYARGSADAARVAAEIAAEIGAAAGPGLLQLDAAAPASGWTAVLDGWAPTDLCYFASPRIRPTRNRRFSAEIFAGLRAVYVDGFLAVLESLDRTTLAHVLYPSSVYVTEATPRLAEYVAAKAAGEALCAALAGLSPKIRFTVPRLPRLASDQTSADEPDAAPVLLEILLGALAGPLGNEDGAARRSATSIE